MPWSDYPLEAIEIPADHATGAPYIYIGSGDPIAEAANEDSAIVFHFGTHNSAFLLGIKDFSTPTADVGSLDIIAASDQNPNKVSIFNMFYQPTISTYTLTFGNTQPGVDTRVMGEEITINDLGQGTTVIPFDVGANSGFAVDMNGNGTPEFRVQTATTTVANTLVNSDGHKYMRGEDGSKSVSFTAVNSSLINVVFATPFTAAPKVFTNINSNAGATAQWHSRAVNITTTGFTILVFAATAGTWSNVEVQWSAEEPT